MLVPSVSSLGLLSHMAKKSLRVSKAQQYRQQNLKAVKVAETKARQSALLDEIRRFEEELGCITSFGP
jgi:hypothetical protein